MKERTIMIFPKFSNMKVIDELRAKYDPLVDKVLPHVTLVFPFKSYLSTKEIEKWMDTALKDIRPFELELQGISKQEDRFGNYLFLDIIKGIDKVKEMHRRLLSTTKFDYPYHPHMTIGKLKTKHELDIVYNELKDMDSLFKTMIDRVSVEIIGEDDSSIIEIEYNLHF